MKVNFLSRFVLAVTLMVATQQSFASHSRAVSGNDVYRNSDEDRFYVDESNWDMLHKELDRRESSHQAIGSLSSTSRTDENYENVTVKVGRKAVLPCFVNNLGSFKVIWAKQGDILALGTTKINSDARLSVQHRYMSEWHLVIENVAADDQAEYICKTNGDFYKVVRLQVLMPPTMDDSSSVPAGTINLAEGSTLNLKCHAEGNPEPEVKWYRWKRLSNGVESAKEELPSAGNELSVTGVDREAANSYECIARNSVPPATSRVFSVQVHFLPTVALSVHSQQQLLLHRQFSLSCQISANPLERVLWYKDGHALSAVGDHYQVSEQRDQSDLEHLYRHLNTLTVSNARISDFGSYQCCAMNAYGQVCASVQVTGQQRNHKESKTKHQHSASPHSLTTTATPRTRTRTTTTTTTTTKRQGVDRDQELILDSISRALATSTPTSSSQNETELEQAKRRQHFRYQAGSDCNANGASYVLLVLCACLLACVRSN